MWINLFSLDSIDLLKSLISDTFGPTLDFITNQCNTALDADLLHSNQTRHMIVEGIQEVASFLRIMSALCDKHLTNDELEPGERDTSGKFSKASGRFYTNVFLGYIEL